MGQGLERQQQLEERYLMHTYGRKPVQFVSGQGMKLVDDDGKEYLDFLSGIGVLSLGHNYPAVRKAVVEQAEKLLHVSNYFYVEHRGQLAAALSGLLESNEPDALGYTDESWRTFFGNSGAEANECAIKLARHWGHTHRHDATGIVTAQRSFHGRTLATLFATGQEWKQDPFLPPVSGFYHVPLNDADALEQLLCGPEGDGIVAVMLECIQGEAGVWPCSDEFLRAARRLTLEHGMLLIIDEVQTGMYRTGKPFAFQTYGIVPDVVTVAKGMGDGAPIGGCCARGELGLELQPGEHGSTFGGSPLVCAAAEATLAGFAAEDIGANVREVGPYLRERLERLAHVVDVRGRGLMVGFDLDGPYATRVVDRGLEDGVVLNATGEHTIRLLPPLICSKADVDVLIDTIAPIIEEEA